MTILLAEGQEIPAMLPVRIEISQAKLLVDRVPQVDIQRDPVVANERLDALVVLVSRHRGSLGEFFNSMPF